jgi:hypothetical protein
MMQVRSKDGVPLRDIGRELGCASIAIIGGGA